MQSELGEAIVRMTCPRRVHEQKMESKYTCFSVPSMKPDLDNSTILVAGS